MPIYEYQCKKCSSLLERFYPRIPVTVPETVIEVCEVCGSEREFKKIISKTTFHLKGTCWANDGYEAAYMGGSRVESFAPPGHPENPTFTEE